MSLQVGLVGLPNVGKSTIFNALTGANAAVASYPFTTIEPNVGVTAVPDQRLSHIAAIVRPQQVVPATVEFVDIAGLIKGSSYGEGLGNQFLSHIRNVDAISMIVRCFRAPQVPHVTAELDPAEDIEVVNLELALADLASVERRLERARQMAKGRQEKDIELELELLQRVRLALAKGELVRRMSLEPEEREMLGPLNLLTAKPMLYVANVGEDELPSGGGLAAKVAQIADGEGAQFVSLCARLEMELATWSAEEAAAYRAELGVEESGIERFVKAGYLLLNLVTFFTTTGGKEVRAWTLRRGSTVLEAAGLIHSDMQRGFIRAEVVSYQDLATLGSFEVVREKGALQVEGRDYLVQDGDIIHIRFSV